MHEAIFTRRGWRDADGLMPFAVLESDGKGHLRYDLEFRECPRRTACFYGESSSIPMPHEDEVASFLLSIALGQRQSTPSTQNKFVGRNNKTFFSGRAHIAVTHRSEHVMNISAMANYVEGAMRDDTCGAVERIYEEYCFAMGNLAYTVMATLRRLDAEDASAFGKVESKPLQAKHYVADPVKAHVPMMELGAEGRAALSKCAGTPSDAVRFVHGVMLCCYVRDHSSIEKDRKNVRLRKCMETFSEVCARVNAVIEGAGGKLGDLRLTQELCEALCEMSDVAEDVIYIVRDGSDVVVNWLTRDMGGVRSVCWRQRYPGSDDLGAKGRDDRAKEADVRGKKMRSVAGRKRAAAKAAREAEKAQKAQKAEKTRKAQKAQKAEKDKAEEKGACKSKSAPKKASAKKAGTTPKKTVPKKAAPKKAASASKKTTPASKKATPRKAAPASKKAAPKKTSSKAASPKKRASKAGSPSKREQEG